MMKFAYLKTKISMKDAIVIQFFFSHSRGSGLENSLVGMYRSLLFQLFDTDRELQFILDDARACDDAKSSQWDRPRLEGIFQRIVENLGDRHLICFIDALDEVIEEHIRWLLEFLEHLLRVALTCQTQLHICYSRRHYPHIPAVKSIALTLEYQGKHREDIANYLNSELKMSQGKFPQEVYETILSNCGGVFLWVVLVVSLLQKEYDSGVVHSWKQLDTIPLGVDELLASTFRLDGWSEEGTLCLQWILSSQRPLSYEELYFGILCEVDPTRIQTPWNSEETSKQDMRRFILSCSIGLVQPPTSNYQSVRFIHEIVEYSLRKRLGLNGQELGHERLKQCCQTCLRINLTQFIPVPSELPAASSDEAANLRREVREKFPLLEYAADNIFYHANAATMEEVSQDEFVANFALRDWIKLNNLFEQYQVRRLSPDTSLLDILRKKGLQNLIAVEVKRLENSNAFTATSSRSVEDNDGREDTTVLSDGFDPSLSKIDDGVSEFGTDATVYSEFPDVPKQSARYYVSLLAKDLFTKLPSDRITLQRVADILADRLKHFALKIGYQAPNELHLDVMAFIHKFRK